MNSKIFSDLLEFIKSAHKAKSVESARTTVIHEIPTAALITGGRDLDIKDSHIYFRVPRYRNGYIF